MGLYSDQLFFAVAESMCLGSLASGRTRVSEYVFVAVVEETDLTGLAPSLLPVEGASPWFHAQWIKKSLAAPRCVRPSVCNLKKPVSCLRQKPVTYRILYRFLLNMKGGAVETGTSYKKKHGMGEDGGRTDGLP